MSCGDNDLAIAGNASGQNDAASMWVVTTPEKAADLGLPPLVRLVSWGQAPAHHDRTNVHGSGISLGHPVGATGGRMLATLAREPHRRQARYGLEIMCVGGGQGLAAVFERVT